MDGSRHTGNTSGDDNDIGILEGSLGSVVLGKISGNFLLKYCQCRCPEHMHGIHKIVWHHLNQSGGCNAQRARRCETGQRRHLGC